MRQQVSQRSQLIDSVKGIGMIMIVMIHTMQWNGIFTSAGYRFNIRTSGLLGVELTFLVNSFLYVKSYEKYVLGGVKSILQLIFHMILRIVPLYWLLLTIYTVVTIVEGNLDVTWWNILMHFLCLNGLTPRLFSSFVGGSGYIGILVLMWMVFPIYLKRIKAIKKAITHGIVCIVAGYLLYGILVILNERVYYFPLEQWKPYLWYIYRGIYCYVIGCILYYLIGKDYCFSKLSRNLCSICILLYIATNILRFGSEYDGVEFTLLWVLLIVINWRDPIVIISNTILSFWGKYSLEIFVAHLLIEYILVPWTGLIKQGVNCFIITWILTIVTAFPLKLFSAMFERLTVKLEMSLYHSDKM